MGPFVGTTTLAKWLDVQYGFMHISMSDVLIEEYEDTNGLSRGVVKENKNTFRTALQDFGVESGFDTDPRWIKRCLRPWLTYKPERDVVIEKVRTNEQARTLRGMGFHIIELSVSEDTRLLRAYSAGVSPEQFQSILKHPIEHGIDTNLIDSFLLAEGPVEVYGTWVAHMPERSPYVPR